MSNKINLKSEIQKDSIFVVGKVFAVNGREIIVEIDKNKNLPHLFFNGHTIRNISVGLSNYVKIMKGFTEIICKVEGEYLEYDRLYDDKKYKNEKQKIKRKIKVLVFGFYDSNGKFQHGIKEMPLIDNECRILTKDEFIKLHKLAKDKELSINIGSLLDEETQEIDLPVAKLFSGHIGIFGNTGSGKSNTLAKMYTELFNSQNINIEKSKFIFIDFNGEYSHRENGQCLISSGKKIYNLNTKTSIDTMPIDIKEIKRLEILSILLEATEKTQRPFLHRVLDNDWYDKENNNSQKEINAIESKIREILNKQDVNFNVPFLKEYVNNFTKLGFNIIVNNKNFEDIKYNPNSESRSFYIIQNRRRLFHQEIVQNINNQINLFIEYFHIEVKDEYKTNELNKLMFRILDRYYYEMLNAYSNPEHINPLIGRLHQKFSMFQKIFKFVSITATGNQQNTSTEIKNIQIINLKNVNLEMKKIVPMIICKSLYDEQKDKRENDANNSLHIIIDEAHNILSEISHRESESWKDYRLETFEEIVKEGRKFGVFLTIASQRPSDISVTIISQLHNYFIHRLMNDNDLKAINRAVAYLDKLSFDSISNLSVGSCFIAGQTTQFPLSVKVDLLEDGKQPKSETINLNDLWMGV